MTKLEDVSHDFFFLRPRVSSRVSGFPVASPCLWGKLQNLSFSKVSKQAVMSSHILETNFSFHTLNSTLYMSLAVISWQAQHFGHVQLHFAWQAQHFRRHFTARGVHVAFHIALFRLNVSHVHFGSWRFCLVSSLWFSCGVPVSMREVTKSLLFECFQAGCHVVLRGRRSTL